MALSQTQFDDLVSRLTVESEHAPGAYKLKVALLALTGYAYIFFVLLGLAALTVLLTAMLIFGKAAVIALKLGIPLLILVWIILRALWVRLQPPDGMPVTRAQAPVLFETIDVIRIETRGPRTHQVLVTDDFNAAVTQIPRLGLFGWQKNYLIIGLPLMQALSPSQFKAVLCHEYGHLSRSHAKFGNWIYRMRLTWARLMGALEGAQHWGAFVFRAFVHWYVPYFNAYSFVLARANEYEADRFAARVCGASTAASALATVEVRARYLSERYWPDVYQSANREPAPSFAPFAGMPARYGAGLAEADAQTWLTQALRRKTGTDDTHPALADRLASLGQPALLEPQPAEAAARYFLGASLDSLTATFDAQWLERIKEGWQQRHQYAREAQDKLAALEVKASRETLSAEEALNRASWTEEFKSADAALPLYEAMAAADDKAAAAHFATGRLLLAREDAAGIVRIEKAVALDGWFTLNGCQHVIAYFVRNGDNASAQPWRERAYARAEQEDTARRERATLPFKKIYSPHGLDETALAAMREVFATRPEIDLAYVVRKRLDHFAELPLYVVGFQNRRFYRADKTVRAVQQRLVNELKSPGECLIVSMTGNNAPLAKIIKKVEGAKIYRR
jgi:Zn-dependent protease with chaperone function